ncbi:MAG TPA: BamA/TamA family outer membrane protein [Gemmatimonadales bacterium]
MAAPLSGAAQTKPDTEPIQRRQWIDHLYPFVYYTSADKFWFGGHYDWSSPLGFAERPEPYFARAALDVGASTQGSYAVILDAQAPAYWDGWRLGLTVSFLRANRLGYYGQGNNTIYDPDSTAASSYFYRVSRTNRAARLTVQRRIAGPLRALVGGSLEHAEFRALPGTTLYQRDSTGPFNDAVARAGLVFDTRDVEADPHRGVFAEGLVASGRGYTRVSGSLHAYVHPLERLILAGRVAAENITGTVPLSVQQTMETSEGQIVAVGGLRSLRGYYDGRFLGAGKLLGGIEARYGLLWAPRLLEVKLIAFYDVGRVFDPGEPVRLTREGLHGALGGGVALSMLRNTLFAIEVGKGTEPMLLTFATAWSF